MRNFSKNRIYFGILFCVLAILISINLYRTALYEQYYGLIPISVQISLIVIILSNSKYYKISIKFWSGFFLILGPSLKIIGITMQMLVSDSIKVDILYILQRLCLILLGFYFFIKVDKLTEE